jgi:hypothetical protein
MATEPFAGDSCPGEIIGNFEAGIGGFREIREKVAQGRRSPRFVTGNVHPPVSYGQKVYNMVYYLSL